MNIFTIVITVVIINWNFRTPRTHRMPRWVRVTFLNYLPRFLFMMRPDHDKRCLGGGTTYTRRVSLFGAPSPTRSTPPPTTLAGQSHHHHDVTGVENRYGNGDYELSNVNEIRGEGVAGRPLTSQEKRRQQFREANRARHVTLTATDKSSQSDDEEDSSDASMTHEVHQAVEAVRFIAAHLKNEEDYAEVGQGQG